MTKSNGTHKWRFSPDRDYILDTWSRVDHPPVTELRLASDGSLVCVLETADWDELIATGWRPPERFVAKARDGESDIHGIIVRPTNIAPDAEYPVIEKIYAGPQGAFVPKSFGRARDVAALAELGFIVVQIDGMGTSHRSKAFHDICWHNLGDAGFPDRIAWMKAAAARYPQIDLTRVGIYGGSAGGQNALRALLAHGDFYKVGAADCGCHDNRMDKIWWNELWMGWPIGPHYEEQSNVTQAHRLTGKLLLTVGELDRNVDPASTMQVVNALIKADKDFDMIVVPGGGHGIGERPYGRRRRMDFFVRHLHGVEPRRQERIATSGFVTTQVGTQQAGSSATEIDTFPSDPSAHPLRALIERYSSDHDSLRRFDGLQASPHRTNRLAQFYAEWQQRLHELDFAELDQDGRVDYLLLKNEIRYQTESLTHNEDRDKAIQTLVPFGTAIVELHEARKRFEQIDSQAVAGQLVELKKQIDDLTSAVEKDELTSEPHIAHRAVRTIEELRRALDRWFRYRAGYDPSFTWWVEKPFKSTDAALEKYGKLVREELVGDESTDGDKIVGEPIGRAALLSELRYEMIPYSPEELIGIGYRELQWCHAELEKAAHELGFGDDWRAALEHVKTLHVEPGKQPELINQLADEAVAFLDKHKLVTIPELCRNSWRMEMMSPESQRVNPYFTGGEVISVSFPTGEMDHQDKLMSMRGNNRHFARATVHHELIPGHHLQLFMADRYRTHRQEFRTPFLVEGWALYWEMLLWDMDFAKSPQDRIGMLFWRSHRCARIIFSLSFHLGTMSSADAIDFLVDNVGHERRNATGEVRRSVIGGYGPLYQAAYMLGGLQLRSLRRQVVDSGKMTSRQFHDAILQENSIPIEMIRAKLTNQSLLPDHETSWRFDPISLIDVE